LVALAATVVGKMYTADLRGETLADEGPAIIQDWLEQLQAGAAVARHVAEELDEAAECLARVQPQRSAGPSAAELEEKILSLRPDHQQIVMEEIRRMLEERQP
jgi:hypothetical protein